MHRSAIVVGAGIVGLATAKALALRGYKVTVLERTEKAVGASIRNFGMIWPIGQPEGALYERALLSKNIWKKYVMEPVSGMMKLVPCMWRILIWSNRCWKNFIREQQQEIQSY